METIKIASAILQTARLNIMRNKLVRIKRHLLSLISLSIAGVFLTGCSMDTSVKDISTYGINDFVRSEVIVSGRGIANSSVMSYTILLKNNNNSFVKGYTPTVKIVSGSASLGGCSSSDVNGVSVCTISSGIIGTVRIKVTNIKISLEHNIYFDPVQASGGQLITGAVGMVEAGTGYKITSSLGAEFSNIRYESVSGYRVYSTVQGDIASRVD